MQSPQSQQKISEGQRVFTEAVEDWLQRPRNPHADEAVLDAVQRRQKRQEDAQAAQATSAAPGIRVTSSATVGSAAQLVKLQGAQPCETWMLPPDRPTLVGRSGKQTATLDVDLWPDTSVSRRHALIWCDGEGWYIEDLRSANGTVLDECNIQGQRAIRLTPGANIRFGQTVLRFMMCVPESGESVQASTEVPPSG